MIISVLSGCGGKKEGAKGPEIQDDQEDGGQASEKTGVIKLGCLVPLSGDYQEYGESFQVGFNKAIEEINADGGVNGYTFELAVRDTKSDAVASSSAAMSFAEDEEIMALLGDFTSGACKANAQICDSYGIVQLSPSASAYDYASMSGYFFGIMGRQDAEAAFLAKNILKEYLGAEKAAVIYVDNDWGLSYYEGLKAQADEEALDVVAETYEAGERDFGSLIANLQIEEPDVLVVIDQGSLAAEIFNQADAAGWKIRHVVLGLGDPGQTVDRLMDKDNLITASPFFFLPDGEGGTEWLEEEAERVPAVYPACAYDCIYLIAEAVKHIDGEVTRGGLRDALADLPEYEGLTGSIRFENDGSIRRHYSICGLEGGEWKLLRGAE